MTAAVVVPNEDKLDLGTIVDRIFDGVQALWAPSAKDIQTERDSFARFVWSVAGPALTQPSDQFESLVAAAATPKTVKEFRLHVESRAFKAWVARSEQEQKVKALRPQDPPKNPYASSLCDDVLERWSLACPLMGTATGMRGAHRPAQAQLDAAYARFLVTVMAMIVASAATSVEFPVENVKKVYDAVTRSIFELAKLHHVAFDRLATKHDAQRINRHEADLVAAERAAEARLQAVRDLDDDALRFVE
jgi:hypothetical protein